MSPSQVHRRGNAQNTVPHHVRVLELEDGCILFNSLEGRLTGRCPPYVAAVVRRAREENIDLDQALHEIDIPVREKERVRAAVLQVAGCCAPITRLAADTRHSFGRTLALCVSSVCSLRCVYCSGEAGERSNALMPWEMARAAIDYFVDNSAFQGPHTLQFHGAGEPTQNWDVLTKATEYGRRAFRERGKVLLIRLSTNGVISSKQAEWLGAHVDHVSLSIDGPEDVHDAQRPCANGQGSYDTVAKTVTILDRAGVLKRINTVVTNASLPKLSEVLRHLRTMCSSRDIRFIPMSYCGRCERGQIEPIDIDEFSDALVTSIPLAERLGFRIVTVLEQLDYFTEHYCGACGFNMCVSPTGKVSTCIEVLDPQRDPGASELIVGHYDEAGRTIAVDWDKVLALRDRTHHALPECKDCVFRTNCSGGCLARAARKNGTVMSIDSEFCRLVKEVLTHRLIAIADAREDSLPPADHEAHSYTLDEALSLSRKVERGFAEVNHRTWGVEASGLELTKQVGDLSKRILMYERYYHRQREIHPEYASSHNAIANELADVLHAVFRIADHYGIDLQAAHVRARRNELAYIDLLRTL